MSLLVDETSNDSAENDLPEQHPSTLLPHCYLDDDIDFIPLDIHTACSIGQFYCVSSLISRDDSLVDNRNTASWTGLMYASHIGHTRIASLLVECGCDVNKHNGRGQNAMMLAASCGNESVGRVLALNGADLEAVDGVGWSALFYATYSGHQNFVCFLLEQQVNFDCVDPRTGVTPLMEAAADGHEIILQLLLQHGASVDRKCSTGETARDLALQNGHINITSLIDNHISFHACHRSWPSIYDGPETVARIVECSSKRSRRKHQSVFSYDHHSGGFSSDSSGITVRASLCGGEAAPVSRHCNTKQSSGNCSGSFVAGVPTFFRPLPKVDNSSALSLEAQRTTTEMRGVMNSCTHGNDFRDCGWTEIATIENGAVLCNNFENESNSRVDQIGKSSSSRMGISADSRVDQIGKSSSSRMGISADSRVDQIGKSSSSRMGISTDSRVDQIGKSSSSRMGISADGQFSVKNEGSFSCLSCVIVDQLNDVVLEGVCCDRTTVRLGTCDDGCFSPLGERLSTPDELITAPGEHIMAPCEHLIAPGERVLSLDEQLIAPGERVLPLAEQITSPGERVLSLGEQITSPGERLSAPVLPVCGRFGKDIGLFWLGEHKNTDSLLVSTQSGPSHLAVSPFHSYFDTCATRGMQGTDSQVLWRAQSAPDVHVSTEAHSNLIHQPVTANTSYVNSSYYPVISHSSSVFRSMAGAGNSDQQFDKILSALALPELEMEAGHVLPVVDHVSPHISDQASPGTVSQAHGWLYGLKTRQQHGVVDDRGMNSVVPDHQVSVEDCRGGLLQLLNTLALGKYLPVFEEQDVDLPVFYSLTDHDLKEIGIKLFGPRKKMLSVIARWHYMAPAYTSDLEQAYADRLLSEKQELTVCVNQANDAVGELSAQLLQERQLRSVTEECLMEERHWWRERIALGNKHLTDIQSSVGTFRSVRRQLEEQLQHVAAVHNTGQLLRSTTSDLGRLSDQEILRSVDQFVSNVDQHVSAILSHTTDQ